MLYSFEKLNKVLDNLGFPKLKGEKGYRVIKGVDFENAYKEGSINFKDDGIYLNYEGDEYRGYMFIKVPYISYNGEPEKFPKFHLTKCKTINEFIESGRFRVRYEWSNSSVNDLIDKQSRRKYKDVNLQLCSNCSEKILEDIDDTKEFHELLDEVEENQEEKKIDINGYVAGFEQLSKKYRESKNFTCEKCGVKTKSKSDNWYWHTHHKNGDKLNNSTTNLQCLCILCHSNVDRKHTSNFSTPAQRQRIDSFIRKYKDELKNKEYL